MQFTDYDQLAKKQNLEAKIKDLNKARAQTLQQLQALGADLPLDALAGEGRVDQKTLTIEKDKLATFQSQDKDYLLAQEMESFLRQAKEGSRLVILERKLRQNPELLQAADLTDLKQEQTHYQRQALEIFDYLSKYFEQFEMQAKKELPDSGVRFFDLVVASLRARLPELLKECRDLQSLVGQEQKEWQKLSRQQQRLLRYLQTEIDEKLGGKTADVTAVSQQNQEYQILLQKADGLQILINSQMNEINDLISEGLLLLEEHQEVLTSILGQNKVTRGALYQLKNEQASFALDKLQDRVQKTLGQFDQRVAEFLELEIAKRYEEKLDSEQQENFFTLIDETLEFHDYLYQIFVNTAQILQDNMEDLMAKRANYGRLVLEYLL